MHNTQSGLAPHVVPNALGAHAERWLTPGTEYAVTEKLPLPREWYTDIETEAVAPSANNLMSMASLPAGFEFDETSALLSPISSCHSLLMDMFGTCSMHTPLFPHQSRTPR